MRLRCFRNGVEVDLASVEHLVPEEMRPKSAGLSSTFRFVSKGKMLDELVVLAEWEPGDPPLLMGHAASAQP